MNTPRILCALTLLVACNEEGNSYVFLADLCSTYAQDVCSARARCCELEEPCVSTVEAACDAQRDELVVRAELSYPTSQSGELRARSVEQMTRCEPPLPVSAFFAGTLALDAECSDDLACASGHCEIDADATSGRCAEANDSLCPSP